MGVLGLLALASVVFGVVEVVCVGDRLVANEATKANEESRRIALDGELFGHHRLVGRFQRNRTQQLVRLGEAFPPDRKRPRREARVLTRRPEGRVEPASCPLGLAVSFGARSRDSCPPCFTSFLGERG